MPVPTIDPATGFISPGRYACSLDEVEAEFGSSTVHRRELWAEFTEATDFLRSVVPVVAAWIGGSFTTTKPEPADVDVTYLVRGDSYATLDVADRTIASVFNGGGVKDVLNLRVDAYLLRWVPALDVRPLVYSRSRGYWDDWWQRQRGAGLDPVLADAIPRRGYLEVELDDYVV